MIAMSDDNNLYTVGEVAERFSVTVRTLHHWEAQGLLAPVERSWSNYRLYSLEDCARVQRIIIYRATGMKLMDIKELLDSDDSAIVHLKRQREPYCPSPPDGQDDRSNRYLIGGRNERKFSQRGRSWSNPWRC